MTDNYVKISFRFYSNILDQWTVETMWAEIVDQEKGLYKLDSIPFYARLIASGDIVYAEYDAAEERLAYRETVEPSGNSTIHVIVMDESSEINTVREIFKGLGCVSERLNERYFALEIPATIDYEGVVKPKLDELKDSGIIDYAESCLSAYH